MEFPDLEEIGGPVTDDQSGVVKDLMPVAEKMAFVGVGQAGSKLADCFWIKGYRRVLAVNTTDQDMKGIECVNKCIIGKSNQGAGKKPEVGAKAASDSKEELMRALYKAVGTDFERIIVCTSSGGGTGCGATPVLIEIAKEYCRANGKPEKVGVIVAGPKKSEGEAVGKNHKGLMELLKAAAEAKTISPLVLVDNERIGKLAKSVSVTQFFDVANKQIVGLFSVFNELSAQASPYMTIDPADYKTILDSGVLTFGMTVIRNAGDKTALAEAVQKNVSGGMLSDKAKITGATHAGGILVATPQTLGVTPQENLDLAFETLNRLLGGSGLVLHQGIYDGPENLADRMFLYVIAGGLQWEI